MVRGSSLPVLALAAALSVAACNTDHLVEPPVEPPVEPSPTPSPLPTSTPNDQTGAIAGRVCSPAGNVWLSNANVWVVQNNSTNDTTQTDASGNFLLQGVDTGSRTLNIQKGSFSTTVQVAVTAGATTSLPTPTCVQSAHVAVVTGDWDSIQNVLAAVGITDVTYYDGLGDGGTPTVDNLLGNPALMASYQIIFINCGDYIDREPALFSNSSVIANLQGFVAGGGSLYASDWAYDFIAVAFPQSVGFYGGNGNLQGAHVGSLGSYTGTVTDPNLAATLGTTSVALDYNLDVWTVISTLGSGTNELVKGNVTTYTGVLGLPATTNNSPLAVQFPVGTHGGSVLYTTFHNEAQTTADMDKILSYMVFQL